MSGAVFLLIALVWIGLAVYVGVDAESNGMHGAGWFIIVLFTGIFGLLYYSTKTPSVKEQELEQRVSQLELNATYCPECGTELIETGCPDCSYQRECPETDTNNSDSSRGPFTVAATYAIPTLLAMAVGIAIWYFILLPVAPYRSADLGNYGTLFDIHRHLKDMGAFLSGALMFMLLHLTRRHFDQYTVSTAEKRGVAYVQIFFFLYMLWKASMVSQVIQTTTQTAIMVGFFIITLGMAVWAVSNAPRATYSPVTRT